jgi:hypothetical protein
MGNQHATSQLVGVIPTDPIYPPDIKYLIFSIGSIRGIAFISAFETLLDISLNKFNTDLQKQIKGVCGTSVGALIAFCISLKLTPTEMRHLLQPSLFKQLLKFEIKQICNQFSVSSIEPIRKVLENVLKTKKIPINITFTELFKFTGVDLVVNAFNITTQTSKPFSTQASPTVSVIDAIIASCSMPYIFEPQQFGLKSQCFVDGSVTRNAMPINVFPESHTLGMYLYDKHRSLKMIGPVFQQLSPMQKNHIISIDVSKLGAVQFNPTCRLRTFIEKQGTDAVLLYYQTISS